MTVLVYLLKVIVVSAILFGYYRLFLCNKRFHHYNRFFLLSALLLSTVLPFIRIPLLYQPENPVHEAVYRTVSVINTDYEVGQVQEIGPPPINESVFTLMNSIYLLYAIGVLFLMTLVIKSLLYIRSLRKRYPAEEITSLRFYNTHEPGTPFSFFRSIFWNDQLPFNSREGQQIFRHELFHVQHQHSADRLLAEVLTAIFWFNPFFHLIKKELKAIHEFLADQFAISDSDRYTYATLLVQQALESGKHRVTNHFFQNHIKRRIAMITQFKQSNYGYWSRVMVLPLALLLFFFVTLYAKKPATDPVERIAAMVSAPSVIETADEGNDNNAPEKQQTARQVKDTVPEEIKKHEELLRMRETHLMEIRKKMEEQQQIIRKVHQAELENLRKQMQEHEVMSREQEVNNKMRLAEIQQVQKELQERKQVVLNETRYQQAELQRIIKEHQPKPEDNDKKRKENEEKVEEAKRALEQLRNNVQKHQDAQEHLMKAKMREIEENSERQMKEQNSRIKELENLKEKIKVNETQIKQNQEKELQRMREELKRQDEELKRKIDEIKREREDIKREKKDSDKEKKDQENKPTGKLFRNEDSLLTQVIRHYLRNLRYPESAIENQAEAKINFSIEVDKDGKFKDFKLHTKFPEDKPVKELVVVTNKLPFTILEEKLSIEEKEKIFRNEIKRVTDFARARPIPHPEERQYFFRAVFKIDFEKSDNAFQIHNTSQWETRSEMSAEFTAENNFQDTIPAKPAKKAKIGSKPAKLFDRDKDIHKPELGKRKENTERRELRAHSVQAEKARLFKSNPDRKRLFTQKPSRPKMERRPSTAHPKKLPRLKPAEKEGSEQIPEEKKEENYFPVSVSSDK